MTVLNLQSKFSDGVITHGTSESDIRNVLAIVRAMVYPIKLYRAIRMYVTLFLVDFSLGAQLAKIKRNIKTGTEFEKMDAFSEIMFIREALEIPVSEVNSLLSKSSGHPPLLGVITRKLNKMYNRFTVLENKYQSIVYPENTELSNPDYLLKLKMDYAKIPHDTVA